MDQKTFDRLVGECFERSKALLDVKKKEYSGSEDRLDQFKIASEMQGMHPLISLSGMMIKHTTSIYQMIGEQAAGKEHALAKWEEKINDHINYLVLLNALIIDVCGYSEQYAGTPTALGKKVRNFDPSE